MISRFARCSTPIFDFHKPPYHSRSSHFIFFFDAFHHSFSKNCNLKCQTNWERVRQMSTPFSHGTSKYCSRSEESRANPFLIRKFSITKNGSFENPGSLVRAWETFNPTIVNNAKDAHLVMTEVRLIHNCNIVSTWNVCMIERDLSILLGMELQAYVPHEASCSILIISKTSNGCLTPWSKWVQRSCSTLMRPLVPIFSISTELKVQPNPITFDFNSAQDFLGLTIFQE